MNASSSPTVLSRAFDAILDTAVLSFALWTLLYSLALPTQWSLFPSGWLWLIATVAIAAWRARALLGSRRTVAGVEEDRAAGDDDPVAWHLLLLVVGLGLTGVAALGGLVWSKGAFGPTWLACIAAAAALFGWSWLGGRLTADAESEVAAEERPRVASVADAVVLGAAVVVGALAAFVHLADTDDPYYLNRSVWVAEHGNAALRDTMFSPEVFNSPYGGGVPISSIEALFGVLAHMTGTLAGSVTYLVAPPVLGFLAVLALWRLARAWAPRRPLLVLLGALAFLLLSGDSMLGNFWIVRIWQGKVVAVALLMPLIWAWLTEVAEARTPAERRWWCGLLLAGGIAFYGLTPTAVVWAPVMFGAVALAALVLRSLPLLVGGVAMLLGPVVSGLAVIAFSTDVGGEDPVALTAYRSFVRILGEQRPMVALSLVACALAVVMARRGAAATLAGASVLAALAAFAPGVLTVLNAATGSGPILWRLLYVAPIPILVGLLLAVPWPGELPVGVRDRLAAGPAHALSRAVVVVPVVVVVLGLALGGRPIWQYTGHGGPVSVSSTPEWKLDRPALEDVAEVIDSGAEGNVLLPPRRMKVLTMYSVEAFPVVPREWFIRNIKEPKKDRQARRLLYDVAAAKPPFPPAGHVGKALKRLDVTLACTGPSPYQKKVLRLLEANGAYARTDDLGSLVCVRPR